MALQFKRSMNISSFLGRAFYKSHVGFVLPSESFYLSLIYHMRSITVTIQRTLAFILASAEADVGVVAMNAHLKVPRIVFLYYIILINFNVFLLNIVWNSEVLGKYFVRHLKIVSL